MVIMPGQSVSFSVGLSYRDSESEWQPISTAPRDGTPVETKCTYGVAPWYGVHRYVDGRWQDARDPNSSVSGDSSLWWRPFNGDVAQYTDPTGGMQDDPAYWRRAAAVKHGLPPDYFEEAAKSSERQAPTLLEKIKAFFS